MYGGDKQQPRNRRQERGTHRQPAEGARQAAAPPPRAARGAEGKRQDQGRRAHRRLERRRDGDHRLRHVGRPSLQDRRPARRRHGAAHEPGADGGPRPRRHDHPRAQRNDEHLRRHALSQADGAGQARQAAGADRASGATATRQASRRRCPSTRSSTATIANSAPWCGGTRGSMPAWTSSASTASATTARRSTTSASRKGSRTSC